MNSNENTINNNFSFGNIGVKNIDNKGTNLNKDDMAVKFNFNSRIWSEEEKEFLIKNHKNYTYRELGAILNRTPEAVESKSRHLGIKNNKSKNWTSEEMLFLIKNYYEMTDNELSKHLGRSPNGIYYMRKKLNISSKRARWTEDELLYLDYWWGIKSVSEITKKLNKTEKSVLKKGDSENLGSMYKCGYYYTTPDLCKIFNVHRTTIKKWINSKKLCGIMKKFNKRKFYVVTPESLYVFMKENQELWNANNISIDIFDEKDEEWLSSKRKKDKLQSNSSSYKRWTIDESNKLMKMYNSGLDYETIAQKLNRSLYSVKHQRKLLINALTSNIKNEKVNIE